LIHWIVLLSILSNFLFHGYAENSNTVTELTNVQTQYQFGDSLSVQAHYDFPTDLRQAVLHFQTATGSSSQFPITISSDGLLQSQISLTDQIFLPFSRVYYWFTLTNKVGTSFTSPSYWFDYVDNRFVWQSNQTKWFNIFWVNGDVSYGEKLQQIALSGLKTATQTLPVTPNLPISIYVYPNAQNVQEILTNTNPDWVAGEAFPQVNLILVSASSDLNSTQDLERQIPHEFTHLLEYSLTRQNYSGSPSWLLEGLATNAETYPNSDYSRILQKAGKSQSLIPMDQLCHSFSPDAEKAALSYAQSSSFVQYLTATYGNEKLMQLLQTPGSGLDCSQLVDNIYGVSLDSLDSNWQKTTFTQPAINNDIFQYWPILAVLIILIVIAVFWRRYSLKKRENKNGLIQ
jgi:hypothetical protein